MRYKIEKECEPCVVCKYTGWETITDCHCSDSKFHEKSFESLWKYWKEHHGDNVKLRVLVKEDATWKQSR